MDTGTYEVVCLDRPGRFAVIQVFEAESRDEVIAHLMRRIAELEADNRRLREREP